MILARFHPKAILKKGKEGALEVVHLLSGLPKDIGRLIKQARRGNLRIDLDLKRLDHFGLQITRSANRLTMGIVTGALIIGSSIVMTVNAGPKLFGLPLLGFLGFILAVLNTVWLVISIWISGKDDR